MRRKRKKVFGNIVLYEIFEALVVGFEIRRDLVLIRHDPPLDEAEGVVVTALNKNSV